MILSEIQGLQLHSLFLPPSLFFLLPRLIVTDRDGSQSDATVTIEVVQGQDYPPTANAGNPVLLHLPRNEVYLYGNGSTDDKVRASGTVA